MKYVIVLLLLSVLALGQEITSTQQYEALINKADSELQDAQKLRDAKVRHATVLYIKALEKKKKAVMAKGDLDKANELDKEIKNLKPLLVKEVVKPVKLIKPKPIVKIVTTADKEKILGYKLKKHPVGSKKGPNGHYYLLVKGSLTWSAAQAKCKEMGGYLATFTTEEELDFIRKVAGETGVWLGGTDVRRESSWTWITGEDMPTLPSGVRRSSKSQSEDWLGTYPKNKSIGYEYWGLLNDFPHAHKLITGFVVEWDN